MSRLRARAPKGERAYGRVPRNRGKNQTLIASVTLEGGMGAALSIEGSTDADLFEVYVEDLLAPTLEAGQVVVLDGLGAHRTGRVRELIEGRGADLEEAFSKIKNTVRKAGARTRQALDGVIGEALLAVTLEDVAGWFSHCGYEPGDQCS